MSDTHENQSTNEKQTAKEAAQDLQESLERVVFNDQKKQRRKRIITLTIGVLLGLGLGLLIAFNWNWIVDVHHYIIAGLIIVAVLVGIIAYLFFYFKESILYKVFGVSKASYEEIYSTLYPDVKNIIEQTTTKEVHEKISPSINKFEVAGRQLIAYLAYRRSRRFILNLFVSIILGLFGFVGTILLLQQNKLLVKQNDLVKEQSYLAEASRRSSLVFLMSNIMDKVDEELKGSSDSLYHSSRNLSQITIGRLAALSQSMKPINYLKADAIINKALSPERGQLLISIANSQFDTIGTYQKIYTSCNFERSDLESAELRSMFLKGVRLKNGNLKGADLSRSELRSAYLLEADLSEAIILDANLRHAHLARANLSQAKLFGSSLLYANLSGANLQEAFLLETNLKGADLRGADLRGADLEGAIVGSKDWFEEQKKNNVKGIDKLMSRFTLKKIPNNTGYFFEKNSN